MGAHTVSQVKLNCWEFKNCGKEPGGRNNGERGTCPAATDTRLDGVHGGKNAGRACWAITGTMCNGDSHGGFAQKFRECHMCDFFRKVVNEEGAEFIFTIKLHEKLHNNLIEIPVSETSEDG
jgi:hypothetical protein